MNIKRATAGVSLALLLVVTVAIAEATLLGLLFVFSAVLRLSLIVEAGSLVVGAAVNPRYVGLQVSVFNAAVVASLLFTAACGMAGALWRESTWRVER